MNKPGVNQSMNGAFARSHIAWSVAGAMAREEDRSGRLSRSSPSIPGAGHSVIRLAAGTSDPESKQATTPAGRSTKLDDIERRDGGMAWWSNTPPDTIAKSCPRRWTTNQGNPMTVISRVDQEVRTLVASGVAVEMRIAGTREAGVAKAAG